MIVFWADCGETAGLGHLMRCLSVADRMCALGASCLFLLKEKTACEIARERGFQAVKLEAGELQGPEDRSRIRRALKDVNIQGFIVDDYNVFPHMLEELRAWAPVAYLDDIKTFAYPCDVLVNYNIYGPDWEQDYKKNQAPFGTRLLLGPRYAPLREEFEALPRHQTSEQVQRVFLSTGGSDSLGIMCRLLKAIGSMPEWSGMEFHAVVGALNPYREQIEQMARRMDNVKVHFQLRQVAELMCRCDVAVSAAGSTLYELCACGVPTVTYVLADNQIPGARSFDRRGLIVTAGDLRQQEAEKTIVSQLQRLMANAALREQISARMQQAVDGKGALRLARALLSRTNDE